MKKQLVKQISLLLLAFLFYSNQGFSQTHLNFKDSLKSKSKYIFDTKDMIFFSDSRSTASTNTCNDREFRVKDKEVILYVKSTNISSLKIYGSSSGSQSRTISKIEIASEKAGDYTSVKFNCKSSIQSLNKGCGTIEVTGLNILKDSFVKIEFDEFVNISEIEIMP